MKNCHKVRAKIKPSNKMATNGKKEESRDLLRSRHITGHLNTGVSGGVSRLRGPRSPHSAGKVSNFQPVGSSSGQQRNSTLFQ